VTLVYVPGKQIAPGKLVSAMLAFIRSVASVYMMVLFVLEWGWTKSGKKRTGSHVACDMLRTSESSVTDGAFVVTSHLGGEKEEEEMVVG
jgi:hypothetical protein